jgi:DNA-binding MarR family transcriptional regulator
MEAAKDFMQEFVDRAEELVDAVRRRFEALTTGELWDEIVYADYRALAVVYRDGPLSIGELSRRLETPQSTISELVGRLARRGFLTKVHGPFDNRVAMLELTASGVSTYRRCHRRFDAVYRALCARLTAEEVAAVPREMRRIVALLEAASISSTAIPDSVA